MSLSIQYSPLAVSFAQRRNQQYLSTFHASQMAITHSLTHRAPRIHPLEKKAHPLSHARKHIWVSVCTAAAVTLNTLSHSRSSARLTQPGPRTGGRVKSVMLTTLMAPSSRTALSLSPSGMSTRYTASYDSSREPSCRLYNRMFWRGCHLHTQGDSNAGWCVVGGLLCCVLRLVPHLHLVMCVCSLPGAQLWTSTSVSTPQMKTIWSYGPPSASRLPS